MLVSSMRSEPANTNLMIVDERSPLDFYLKELDSQPFSYYLSVVIRRVNSCQSFPIAD
jgi:hypothetical protein